MRPGEKKRPSKKRPDPHPQKDLEEAELALGHLRTQGPDAKGPAEESNLARMERTRLRAAAWTAEQTLRSVRNLACAVTGELDFRNLIRQVLESSVKALQAERGILFLGREDSSGLVPVFALDIEGEELKTLEHVSRTVLRKWKTSKVFLTHDALRDPRLAAVPSVELNQIHSILLAPLVGPSGLVGALYLDTKGPDAFPPDTEQLVSTYADIAARALQNARVHHEVLMENARLRVAHGPEDSIGSLVGSSYEMERLRRQAEVAAITDGPVLIRGERGTGRDLLARALHRHSARSHRPFIAWDCSAVPPELLKGFLLGRTGVAASGSFSEETGVLARVDGGVLFLAEADRIDAELGDQLAEIIERGAYRPMGGRRDIRVDVRLLLGTAKDLVEDVGAGHFSANLLGKVEGLTIWIPPLRERREDVAELVEHFIRRHYAETPGGSSRRGAVITFAPRALDLLRDQPWLGNVRELEHVVRRSILFARGDTIDPAVVQRAILPPTDEEAKRQGPWSGLTLTLDEWEQEAIRQALSRTRGNMSLAARLLGVHRNTIVRKMRIAAKA